MILSCIIELNKRNDCIRVLITCIYLCMFNVIVYCTMYIV